MADGQGNPLDFLRVKIGAGGRPAGVYADTLIFRNGALIMEDANGVLWQITITLNADGVTGTFNLQQVTL